MKLYDTFNPLTAIVILAFLGSAEASNFQGNITQLRMNTDAGGGVDARVSINTGPHGGPCGNNAWYAYQPADSGVGKLWTDALIASHMNNRQVFINGNNICDGADVEGVRFIDFK